MSKLQELIDKRATAWADAQTFNTRNSADGDELSAEEQQSWERAMDDIDSLTPQIELIERTNKLGDLKERQDDDRPSTDTNGGTDDEQYRAVFDKWLRRGATSLNEPERDMLMARAQEIGTDAGGGYTVPEGFWAKVTETMKAYGNVASVAEVLNTSAGNKIPWPTNDDTANIGELLDENTATGEEDLVFGTKDLEAFMYSTKMIRASIQFLQDTGIDAEGFIARKAGERLGRITNQHLTTGTGVDQPQGIVTGGAVRVTAVDVTAVLIDELIELEHSIDPAYRTNGGQFMLHDQALKGLRKLKDGDGRYIWQPSVQAGVASTLLGHGYTINQDMATPAAASKSIMFGDFRSAFVVRNVSGGAFTQLRERYAERFQVAFLGFSRHDSVVQDPAAYGVLQQAAS